MAEKLSTKNQFSEKKLSSNQNFHISENHYFFKMDAAAHAQKKNHASCNFDSAQVSGLRGHVSKNAKISDFRG